MSDSASSSQPDSTEQLLLNWLEERQAGRGLPFEELSARHPDRAQRLDALRKAHERALRLFELPIPRADRGSQAPPTLTGDQPQGRARYEVRGQIAQGGMGRILEVYDPSLRRTIAMKVLRSDRPDAPTSGALEHLLRQRQLLTEAQILGQLDHPGVVSIHEVGLDAEGQAYFTMKRVRGHDFSGVIRAHHAGDESWRLPRAVGVLQKACEALAYAHSKGVIHRDLKPSNVMVGRFGEVFVMDWGLARVAGRAEAPPMPVLGALVIAEKKSAADASAEKAAPTPSSSSSSLEFPLSLVQTDRVSGAQPTSSEEGSVVGTPAFMAPEQARGEVESIDARADVYALGAILYDLLAGRAPYARKPERSAEEILAAVLAGPPERLARLAPRAPEELVAICEKAMARDPGARFATMLELAEDLRAWLEGRVVRAHQTGAWAELSKWVGRNRGSAAAIVVLVLGLGTTALVQSLLKRDLERAHLETAGRVEELRREDYYNRVALASAALSSGDIGHMRELLLGCPETLREWEWRHLWRESDTSELLLNEPDLELRSVLLLPDGRLLIAGIGSPHRIRFFDPASAVLQAEIALPEGRAINNVTVSADGELMAVFVYLGDLRLWRLDTLEPLPSLDVRMHGWQGAAFAPRGHLLAAYGTEGVELWDVDRRSRTAALAAGQQDISDVAWSADGSRLFAASWDGSVSVWDVESASLIALVSDGTQRMQQVECSPDGRWLAGGDWDSRVFLWDTRTLELVHRSDRVGGHIWALAWSPDSSLLAVGGGASVVRLLEAGTWESIGRLVGHSSTVFTIQFAGEHRLLTGGGLGDVRAWNLDRPGWRTLYRDQGSEPPAGVTFSPSGAEVAIGWSQGRIEVWNVRERIRERAFPVDASIRHLDWSPTGELLAVADWNRDVLLVDARSGSVRSRILQAEPTEVHFDGGGGRLAATSNDGFLRVWDAHTGALAWEACVPSSTSGWPGRLFGGSWSQDGQELVASSFEGRIQVRDAATGALRRESRRPGMIFSEFARDGLHVLATAYSDNQGMELLDARTLEPLWTCGETIQMWPVLSPDGKRVFSANWHGGLGVWDARSGRLVAEIEGLPPGNPRLGISPDGTCVVLAAGKYLGFFDTRARD